MGLALSIAMALVGVLPAGLARAEVRDRWEVTLSPPPAFVMESADVNNPLGTVTVRGWDREAVRIVAEKWAPNALQMRRLKVLAGFCTDGSVCVKTYVVAPEGQHAPSALGGRIDLIIDVPRKLPLRARTFVGDVEAVGMRSGAHIESKSGAVRVRDVHGRVVARTLRGSQTVAAVQGPVELSGIAGDLDLAHVDGDRLVARTVEGSIRATRVRAEVIRFSTTAGDVWLVDFQPVDGGRYELSTFDGGIRVRPSAEGRYELVARNLGGRLLSRQAMRVKSRSGRMVRASLNTAAPAATQATFALTAVGDISFE